MTSENNSKYILKSALNIKQSVSITHTKQFSMKSVHSNYLKSEDQL